MHYALSNVIIRDNKFAKVNHYYVLIYEHKQVNPFSNGEKLSKVRNKYFVNKRM